MLRRLLSSVVEIRPEEIRTALLMFTYSFAAMTAYNIVQPVTRSAFITTLGADNIPYVLFATGLLIGFIMQFLQPADRASAASVGHPDCPARADRPPPDVLDVAPRKAPGWVSAGFYLFGQVLGTLLVSQFWTVANDVYNPRQARRLYGFIGGGASLGGMAGSGSGGGSGGACRRRRVAAVQRGSAGRRSRCRRLHHAAGTHPPVQRSMLRKVHRRADSPTPGV